MKSGAGPASRDLAKADSMVLAMVPDRNNKRQAPPPLVPTDRWTPAEAIDHIQRSRAKTIAFMAGTPALRAHVADIRSVPWMHTNGSCLSLRTVCVIPTRF